MKTIEFLKKNNYNILLPLLTIVSFFTWYFKFDFVVNIYVYVGLLLILTLLRQSVSSHMLVVLFSVFATYTNELHLLYQILFIYTVIYFIIKNFYRLNKIKGSLFWPLTLLTSFSLLSMIWAPTVADSLAEFLVIIQGVVTYFLIVNDEEEAIITPKNIAWLTSFLLLVLGAEYFILTYQYFPKAPNKAHLAEFWINPNLVATALGLLWLPSLYKYCFVKENKFILLYLPLEILTIYAIYMSMSRGLYFGYIVGGVALILLFFKLNIKTIRKIFFSFIGITIIFILSVILIKDIFSGTFNSINDFSSSRISIYELALTRLRNPLTFLFGDGVGSARYYLVDAGMNNFYYHSWFFQILTTRGIFSLILQFILIWKIFNILDNQEQYTKFIMLGFIIYISHSLIDIGYQYQFLGIIYYLIIGTTEKNNTLKNMVKI